MIPKISGYAKLKREAAIYLDGRIHSGKDMNLHELTIYFQTQWGFSESILRKLLEPYVSLGTVTITQNSIIINKEEIKQQ